MSDQKIDSTTEAESVLSSDLMVGTVFESRYEILSILGSGGSATAYKANDVLLLRPVALKVIHAFLLSQEKSIERFMQEARTCTILEHKNIAKVYASGVASDGRPYMVMDLLEGKTLSQIIKDSGPLSLDRFFSLFRQLIDALSYAHAQKVVHRDIKPSNIVVVDSAGTEEAILVDFGIAKLIDQQTGQSSTQTGALLGSTAYMSPEQCVAGTIDERSDIYSLACTMIEALTGKAPYEGESAFNIMYKHLNESLGHLGFLKEMPEAVAAMLGKCLQKKPELRYQSMVELKADFDKCSLLDTSQRQWKRPAAESKKISLFLLIPVLLGIGLAAYFLISQRPTAHRAVDLVTVLPKKVDRQIAAKDVVPQQNLHLMTEKLKKYPELQDKITILENWLKKFDAVPAPEEQPFIKAEIRFYLADFYAKEQQLDKAAALLEEAVKMDASRPAIEASKPLRLAEVYRQQLKPREALALLAETRKRYGAEFDRERYYDHSSLAYGTEGRCWTDLGEFEKADKAFVKAIELGDANTEGLLSYQNQYRTERIKCLIRLNRLDEISPLVEGSFMRSCNSEFRPTDVYLSAADACYQQGARVLALDFLKKAERESQKSNNYHLEQVKNWFLMVDAQSMDPKQRYNSMMALSERATNFDGKVAALHGGVLPLFQRDRTLGKVVSGRIEHLFKQHLTVDPNFLWKNPGFVGMLGLRCDILENLGLHKQALEEAQFWIDKCKGQPCESLVGLYETEAKAYNFLHEIDAALASNEKALSLLNNQAVKAEIAEHKLTPLSMRIANAYAQRLGLLNLQSRFSEAEQCGKKALAAVAGEQYVSGTKSSLYGSLGQTLEREGKFDEAEAAYKNMVAWDTYGGRMMDNQTAYEIRLYSGFLTRRQKYVEAEAYARLALKHIVFANAGRSDLPIFRQFWNDLGVIELNTNKFNEALSNFDLVIASSIKHKQLDAIYRGALSGLADTYCHKGEYAKAVDPLLKLIKLAPPQQRAVYYKWLSDCNYQLKQPDQRLSNLKKAVAIGREVNDRSKQQKDNLTELANLLQTEGKSQEAQSLLSEARKLASQ